MSLFYKMAYQLGITPWERASETHGFLISALLDRKELGRDRPYGCALDLGCFHGLNEKQRAAMGREVSAIAAPDAVLLELVWVPASRALLPKGASRDDLAKAFHGWEIVGNDALDVSALPDQLKKADPHCYRLRRAVA